jgi:hypothetical protein
MNDNQLPPIADERLLAAMKAVNPPVEKLMADRLALRQEMKQAKDELERVRHHLIPRYICIVKAIVLGAATMALIALALALFKGSLRSKPQQPSLLLFCCRCGSLIRLKENSVAGSFTVMAEQSISIEMAAKDYRCGRSGTSPFRSADWDSGLSRLRTGVGASRP